MTDQRFYDDEEEEELEEGTEEEEVEEGTEDDSEMEEESESPHYSQERVSEIVQNRLHRERKKVMKELGMSMQEAKEYIEAGQSVTRASGLTPAQVRQRLIQQQQQSGQQGYSQDQQSYNPPAMDDDVRKEIQELRTILTDQQLKEKRDRETVVARQEFGNLYDEYEMEIEDKAEDLDISVVDAAAMVLRPKLKDHYETRTKKKQQTKKRRKLEGSGEAPSGSDNPEEVLSAEQIRVAKGMRIPLDRYLKRLREKGEV